MMNKKRIYSLTVLQAIAVYFLLSTIHAQSDCSSFKGAAGNDLTLTLTYCHDTFYLADSLAPTVSRDGSWKSAGPQPELSGGSRGLYDIHVNTSGRYYYIVKAIINISLCADTAEINVLKDNTPPKVSSPGTVSLPCSPPVPNFFDKLVGTDKECDIDTFIQTPEVGSAFARGQPEQEVTVIVYDKSGNQTTTKTKVFLEDTEPPITEKLVEEISYYYSLSPSNSLFPNLKNLIVSSDNCGVDTIEQSPSEFTEILSPLPEKQKVIFTVKDKNELYSKDTIEITQQNCNSIFSDEVAYGIETNSGFSYNAPNLIKDKGLNTESWNTIEMTYTQKEQAGKQLSPGIWQMELVFTQEEYTLGKCSYQLDLRSSKLPEAFSPNNDGINDYLVLPGVEKFPNNKVVIFSRWGNIVYQKEGYGLKQDELWDGRAPEGDSERKVPAGLYHYEIFLTGNYVVQGTVMVIY